MSIICNREGINQILKQYRSTDSKNNRILYQRPDGLLILAVVFPHNNQGNKEVLLLACSMAPIILFVCECCTLEIWLRNSRSPSSKNSPSSIPNGEASNIPGAKYCSLNTANSIPMRFRYTRSTMVARRILVRLDSNRLVNMDSQDNTSHRREIQLETICTGRNTHS